VHLEDKGEAPHLHNPGNVTMTVATGSKVCSAVCRCNTGIVGSDLCSTDLLTCPTHIQLRVCGCICVYCIYKYICDIIGVTLGGQIPFPPPKKKNFLYVRNISWLLIYKHTMKYQPNNKTLLCLLLYRATCFDSYRIIFRPF